MEQRGTRNLDRTLALADAAMRQAFRPVQRTAWPAPSACAGLLLTLSVLVAPSALAYRPFDSTDADVVDPGEVEIEVSPLSYRRGDDGRVLIAPAVVVNYGLAPGWEVIVEGQGEHPRSGGRSSLLDNALLLKHVLRAGELQGGSGLSVATEFGVELPGINGESGAGAVAAGIVSRAGPWGAWHLTAEVVHTRESTSELALGTILEGPEGWKVRPVAEITYAHELGEGKEAGILAGAIWTFSERLVFDAGVRRNVVGEARNTEVRVGFSYAFP